MPWELPDLLDPDMVKEGWAELQTLLRLDETLDGIRTPRLKVSALEMNWYMRHQLLRDSDWAGMGHSVEIRVPFVDVNLLGPLASLVSREPGLNKRDVARAALSQLQGRGSHLHAPSSEFLASVLDRPKTGFQVPVRDWLMSPLRYGTFQTRRYPQMRGLRGWAREVYSRFVATEDQPRTLAVSKRRPAASQPAPKLEILMLLSDAFGGFGGIAKFNRDFISALSSSDDVVRIVAVPRLMHEASGELPPKVAYATAGLGGKRSYIRTILTAARQLRASKQMSVRPVIICGHINLLPAAVAARRITGADLYLVIHGIDAWQPTRDPIANACLGSVDDFLSVSAVTRRRFLQWSGLTQDKGIVLPNCVDLTAFGPAPKSERLIRQYDLDGAPVLLTLGRLASEERYKGFDEIIECLPVVAQQVPAITYLVVGDGPDRARLVAKARSLGLKVDDFVDNEYSAEGSTDSDKCSNARVAFVGRISDEDKADYIRLADLFVMPSSGEGFGIVLLEAMACGVPVIGSKIDGSREALREGKLGKLVDPRNLDEIAEAIVGGLSETKDRTRSVRGVEYFSNERFEERVHTILGSIRGDVVRGEEKPFEGKSVYEETALAGAFSER